MLAYGHMDCLFGFKLSATRVSFLTKWWFGQLPFLGSRYSTLLCIAWHNKMVRMDCIGGTIS